MLLVSQHDYLLIVNYDIRNYGNLGNGISIISWQENISNGKMWHSLLYMSKW